MNDLLHGFALSVAAYALAGIAATTCTARAQDSGDQRLPNPPAAIAAPRGAHVPVRVEDTGLSRVPRSARRELALALAQVAVNEAGWDSPADVAMIWQIVESKRAITDERRVWLAQHSRRVLGGRDCAPGRNCRWTRNLTWSDDEPREWPASQRWRPERWRAVRALAWRLVTGAETRRPCEEAPDTWDGARWRARHVARGMRLVVCRGTRNDGWSWSRS